MIKSFFKAIRSSSIIGKMWKYGIVGLLGTALHFSILVLLVEWGRIHPVLSSGIGFVVVLVVSFILNRKWTFVTHPVGKRAFLKYVVVSVTGLVLNTGIMFITVEWLQFPYLLGQLLVIFVVPPSNFLLNYYWTFNS